MTNHTPLWVQPSTGDPDETWSALELRNFTRGFASLEPGVAGFQGVLPSSTVSSPGFHVVQRAAGANFSVDVQTGKAAITDDDVSNGGAAHIWADAVNNVVIPNPPSSGTEVHRIVLQFRDKLENPGSWSTYDFAAVCLPDTGSGTPAEPNSAITIAFVSVAAGQSSVTNSNITDYRECAGNLFSYKTSDLGRTSTTMSADPDLQLMQLAANAVYYVDGVIFYDGGASGGSEGDIKFGWNLTSASLLYACQHINESNQQTGGFAFAGGDTVTAETTGVGATMDAVIKGLMTTNAAPASALFKWSKDHAPDSTNTHVLTKSFLRARRVA